MPGKALGPAVSAKIPGVRCISAFLRKRFKQTSLRETLGINTLSSRVDYFMSVGFIRRRFASVTVGFVLFAGATARAQNTTQNVLQNSKENSFRAELSALEAKNGGRLGVSALDTGSNRRLSYRADERFAMCSTHKFITVSAILKMVDLGTIKIDEHIHYSNADILSYAPITRQHLKTGFMTVGALCQAAIEWSDNTAANLLLGLIGGPSGWTRFARSIGDDVSRLDRTEPTLNTATPGDPRDTTSPAMMAHDLDSILLRNILSGPSRQLLTDWMLDNQITNSLLRAGMPKGWRVADKSGSGDNGTRNDVGLILPPLPRRPIIAAVYYTNSREAAHLRDALIAKTGQIIAQTFV